MIARLRHALVSLTTRYSGILLIRDPWLGALALTATFVDPDVALGGLTALAAAQGLAHRLRVGPLYLRLGVHTYNPLLVGLMVGFLFQTSLASLALAAVAGTAAMMLALSLNARFAPLGLPVLSLPFACVSWALHLALPRLTGLPLHLIHAHPFASLAPDLPLPLLSFLRSLGTIAFLPDPMAGLILAAGLAMASPILLILALLGWTLGILAQAALSGHWAAMTDLYSFNYSLIAMALGGVFLIPGPASLGLAALAVLFCALILTALKVAGAAWGLPVSTFPFVLTCLLMLHGLAATGFGGLTRLFRRSPEDALDHHLARPDPTPAPALLLPFSGRWTVWQEWDGAWTHQGALRHAMDFVITNGLGATFAGDGSRLDHYLAWNKPILSPVNGQVVRMVTDLPDNPPGQTDLVNNWGNALVIRDDWGNHVCIAHFAQHSIRVQPGDRIQAGQPLGRCGNSGNSPQPHIHIQVQQNDRFGAATLPFCFTGWVRDNKLSPPGLPQLGDQIEACHGPSQILSDLPFFHEAPMTCRINGGPPIPLSLQAQADGTLALNGDGATLYGLAQHGDWRILACDRFIPWAAALFLVLGRLPLAARPGLSWDYAVPVGAIVPGLGRRLILLAAWLVPSLGRARVLARMDMDGAIHGRADVAGRPSRLSFVARWTTPNHLDITLKQETAP